MSDPMRSNQTLAAWIVALTVLGAMTIVPTRDGDEQARLARPLAADVSLLPPVLRGGGEDGAADLLPFAYDLEDAEIPAARLPPALVDADS